MGVTGWRLLIAQPPERCTLTERSRKGVRRRREEEPYGIASDFDGDSSVAGSESIKQKRKKAHTREMGKWATVACL